MEIKYKNKQLVNSTKNKFDLIYPVGYVYTTYDKNFDPNSDFYGTWVKIPLVDSSNNYISNNSVPNYENIIVTRVAFTYNSSQQTSWKVITNKGTELWFHLVDYDKVPIIVNGGEDILAVHRISNEGTYPNTENSVLGLANTSDASGSTNSYLWAWGVGPGMGKQTTSTFNISTETFSSLGSWKRTWGSAGDDETFGNIASKQTISYDFWTLKQLGTTWFHSLGNIAVYPVDFACSFRLEHRVVSNSAGGWGFYKRGSESPTVDTLHTLEIYELADSNTTYQKWLRTA